MGTIEILVVEDDEGIRRLLTSVLRPYQEREAVRSYFAPDLPTALARMNLVAPQVLITEWTFGKLTSENLVSRAISAGVQTDNVLVISENAHHAEPAARVRGLRFEEKPMRLAKIRAFVDGCINRLAGGRVPEDELC